MSSKREDRFRWISDIQEFLYNATIVVLVIVGFISCITIGWKILSVGLKETIIDSEINFLYKQLETTEEKDQRENIRKDIRDLDTEKDKLYKTKDSFSKWFLYLHPTVKTLTSMGVAGTYILMILLLVFSLLYKLLERKQE